MTDRTFDYEQLNAMGWTLNPQTGINRPGFASVSFCLMLEGRKHICLPGFGYSVTEAIADVVRNANQWIARQQPTHPLHRQLEVEHDSERQTA